MRHCVLIREVVVKTECRCDGENCHHTCHDATLIPKNQQDSAADFDHDSDEIGQKREGQAGGGDEALRQRWCGDLAESTDQEKRSDEKSTDSADVWIVFKHVLSFPMSLNKRLLAGFDQWQFRRYVL